MRWGLVFFVTAFLAFVYVVVYHIPEQKSPLITTQQAENICQASVAYCYDSVATVMCIRSLEACKLASEMAR